MPALLRPSSLAPASSSSVANVIAARAALGEKTLSYEFFPPKSEETADQGLWAAFDELVTAGFDFVSVTYGAGGSNREKSFSVLERMAQRVLTVGHLTAVGASREDTRRIIDEFRKRGVRTILALRGDSPKDNPDALQQGELKQALELVQLAAETDGIEIGVAAFPEGHPESPSLAHDAQVLHLKQQAGADFAITQLFFGVEHYEGLLADASREGVTMPIIPGVMPISNAKQVMRMAQLSGAAVPQDLVAQLDAADPESAREIGMAYTVGFARGLLAAGAPGLHIYTLNQAPAALEIARAVGLVS